MLASVVHVLCVSLCVFVFVCVRSIYVQVCMFSISLCLFVFVSLLGCT